MDEFTEDECSVFRTTNDPTLVNQIRYLKERVFLYLLFYVDEYHEGRNMIAEAAQTRLMNIKSKKGLAFCIPIQSIDEVATQIPKIIKKHSDNGDKKVLISEMGFFSHSGFDDGPVSYNTPIIICPIIPSKPNKHPTQMDMCGWDKIQAQWASDAKCVFYGCNTANPKSKNFAKKISNLPNFKNVEVWGQPIFSFPSLYPDYRVTTVARSIEVNISGKRIIDGIGWDIRKYTYMVAGNAHDEDSESVQAISLRPDKSNLTPEQLENSGYPKARPMNCYKNGEPIKSSHQGVFNDHRKQ